MQIKIRLIIFFLFIMNLSYSQKEMPWNNPIYDHQIYHFGFIIGVSNTKFQIEYGNSFVEQSNFEQILSKYQPGFNVGIIMDLKIGKNHNLRITPSFNFTDQKLYFINNNIPETYPENNTGVSNFEIPVYLKYRSNRINNGRAYIVLGANCMIDMSATEKLVQSQNLEFHKTNYSIDIGFGVDMYFSYFKFSPEIKYSYGLRNMLIDQKNEFNDLINHLSTRGLLISLTFE